MGWRTVFFTGLVLWLGSVVVTALTENLNMIPTVVLLGSFLVPASGVVWYLDHYHSPELTPGVVRGAGHYAVGNADGQRFAVTRRCRHLRADLANGTIDAEGCLVDGCIAYADSGYVAAICHGANDG